MNREAWVARKLHSIMTVAKAARRTLQEERFDLEDDRVRFFRLYVHGEVDLGQAVTVATRCKIHRILHEALGLLARGIVPDTLRLRTLVGIHLNQLRMLQSKHRGAHQRFYTDMLHTVEQQSRWLGHLR